MTRPIAILAAVVLFAAPATAHAASTPTSASITSATSTSGHESAVQRLHQWRWHWPRLQHSHRLGRHVLRERRATRDASGQVGTRYTWGGASPSTGFDCSGLVMWAYGRVGVHLAHSTWSQMASGRPVHRAHLRRGDLVFSYGGGHVGIYLGHGVMLAATHTGGTVSRSPLAEWQVVAIRRVG